MIRVLIVDDQMLVRQGIRSLLDLTSDVVVVGEAADGVEALERIEADAPDVVLLDMRMPRLDGLGVLEALRGREGAPPAMILTTFDDDELLLRGIRAGAKGYLLKDVSLEQLVDGVRTVHAGRTLLQPSLTERIVRTLQDGGRAKQGGPAPDDLTERETEVLRLMAGGYSNKQIARALDLTEGTVKNHVSHVLSKLGVGDRTRAVLKAIETGLI